MSAESTTRKPCAAGVADGHVRVNFRLPAGWDAVDVEQPANWIVGLGGATKWVHIMPICRHPVVVGRQSRLPASPVISVRSRSDGVCHGVHVCVCLLCNTVGSGRIGPVVVIKYVKV